MSITVMSRQDKNRQFDALFKAFQLHTYLQDISFLAGHWGNMETLEENLTKSIQKYKHLYYFNQNDHCQISGRGKK